MEQVQSRVQTSITTLMEKLDKEYLRQLQGDMYRCNAKCCDDSSLQMHQVQRCIETCSMPMTSSQKYVEGEVQNFQNRLQRCAYQCQDQTRDKVTPSTTEAQMEGYKREMESCIVKCGDDHVALVDNMLVRMRETLKLARDKQQGVQVPTTPLATASPIRPGMTGGYSGGAPPMFPSRMPAGASPFGMPMGLGAGDDD